MGDLLYFERAKFIAIECPEGHHRTFDKDDYSILGYAIRGEKLIVKHAYKDTNIVSLDYIDLPNVSNFTICCA
jgi:hypothetical protein